MNLDRALDTKTDEIVALKKMRMENEKDGEFFLQKVYFLFWVIYTINLYYVHVAIYSHIVYEWTDV